LIFIGHPSNFWHIGSHPLVHFSLNALFFNKILYPIEINDIYRFFPFRFTIFYYHWHIYFLNKWDIKSVEGLKIEAIPAYNTIHMIFPEKIIVSLSHPGT